MYFSEVLNRYTNSSELGPFDYVEPIPRLDSQVTNTETSTMNPNTQQPSLLTRPITVKCVSETVKDQIVYHYKTRQYQNKEIAEAFSVSPRTVNRVLEERGLATPVARLKGEAYRIMKAIESADLTADQVLRALGEYKNRPVVPGELVNLFAKHAGINQNGHSAHALPN